jgi:hypothetical protein
VESLISLLVPIIFVIIILANIRAQAKQARQRMRGTADEGGVETYKASTDEIKKFLRSVGYGASEDEEEEEEEETPAQRTRPGMPGGVVPTAPRAREVWPPAPRPLGSGPLGSRPVAPRPLGSGPAAPSTSSAEPQRSVERRVTDEQRLRPTVPEHLRERHLDMTQRSLEPTIEEHLKQRGLAETQHSLEPTIPEHLRRARLAETPPPGRAPYVKHPVPVGPHPAAPMAGGPRAVHVAAARKRLALPRLTNDNLRKAFVMAEILQPPLAVRTGQMPGDPRLGRM